LQFQEAGHFLNIAEFILTIISIINIICYIKAVSVPHIKREENNMKKEKLNPVVEEPAGTVDKKAAVKSATVKKKSKATQDEETPTIPPKVKKTKTEKDEKIEKKVVEPKEKKAPKEDKVTKFLVSMKKSVRKSVKKEAAEAGISMNEFIVLAVEEKLRQG